jgi:hypothetical protein
MPATTSSVLREGGRACRGEKERSCEKKCARNIAPLNQTPDSRPECFRGKTRLVKSKRQLRRG